MLRVLSIRASLKAKLMQNPFNLPFNYKVNGIPEYFIDDLCAEVDGVFQPDVYELAGRLASHLRAHKIVDLGCGNADKLCELNVDIHKVGVDFGSNLKLARIRHPELTLLEIDLQKDSRKLLHQTKDAIVISSDVIEHLENPLILIQFLKRCLSNVAGIVISTPDRDVARGLGSLGPPENRSHVMEWNRSELNTLLHREGLKPLFHENTRTNNLSSEKGSQTIFVPGKRFDKYDFPAELFAF